MSTLVNVDEYHRKEKSLALLKIIAQSTQDIAVGNHKPADEVIARLRKKVQAARDARK